MDTPDYVVSPLPGGRFKNLLLTLAPPLVLMYLLRYLIDGGVIPNTNGMASLLLLIPLAFIWLLSDRLIYRKNHTIAVFAQYMIDTNNRKKERRIDFNQVCSVKTNFLGEIVVKDAHGKILLYIEENMENRERLVNRLRSLVQYEKE